MRIEVEDEFEHREHDEDLRSGSQPLRTEYFADAARTVLSENDSPDILFRYSLNPYRGCTHGWICSFIFSRLNKRWQDNGLQKKCPGSA